MLLSAGSHTPDGDNVFTWAPWGWFLGNNAFLVIARVTCPLGCVWLHSTESRLSPGGWIFLTPQEAGGRLLSQGCCQGAQPLLPPASAVPRVLGRRRAGWEDKSPPSSVRPFFISKTMAFLETPPSAHLLLHPGPSGPHSAPGCTGLWQAEHSEAALTPFLYQPPPAAVMKHHRHSGRDPHESLTVPEGRSCRWGSRWTEATGPAGLCAFQSFWGNRFPAFSSCLRPGCWPRPPSPGV